MKFDSITAPAGATALTTTGDAEMAALFSERRDAQIAYMNLPTTGDRDSAEAVRLDDLVGKLETAAERADVATVTGVEMKLWIALSHLVVDPDQDRRSYGADLEFFEQNVRDLDWPARMVLSAIRSLRACGGAA